jgi:hypothetical protein
LNGFAENLGAEESVKWQDDFRKNSDDEDFLKSRDFTPPIYNVWKQQNKSNKVNHFGTAHAVTLTDVG